MMPANTQWIGRHSLVLRIDDPVRDGWLHGPGGLVAERHYTPGNWRGQMRHLRPHFAIGLVCEAPSSKASCSWFNAPETGAKSAGLDADQPLPSDGARGDSDERPNVSCASPAAAFDTPTQPRYRPQRSPIPPRRPRRARANSPATGPQVWGQAWAEVLRSEPACSSDGRSALVRDWVSRSQSPSALAWVLAWPSGSDSVCVSACATASECALPLLCDWQSGWT